MTTTPSLAEVIALIPTSWLDPLLSGPDAALSGKGGTWGCPDIERLLNGIRKRIESEYPSLRDEVLLPIAVAKQAEQVASEWLTLHGVYVRADDIERYQYAPAVEELCAELTDAIDAATHPAAQERQP